MLRLLLLLNPFQACRNFCFLNILENKQHFHHKQHSEVGCYQLLFPGTRPYGRLPVLDHVPLPPLPERGIEGVRHRRDRRQISDLEVAIAEEEVDLDPLGLLERAKHVVDDVQLPVHAAVHRDLCRRRYRRPPRCRARPPRPQHRR